MHNHHGEKNPCFRHGECVGGKPSVELYTWNSIRQRCYDPKNKEFKNYMARGITVCERWHKFENFLADMGRRPEGKTSIGRIDNSLGYSPENCRWETASEQVRNTRNTLWCVIDGKEIPFIDACKMLGIKYMNARNWIARKQLHKLPFTLYKKV